MCVASSDVLVVSRRDGHFEKSDMHLAQKRRLPSEIVTQWQAFLPTVYFQWARLRAKGKPLSVL